MIKPETRGRTKDKDSKKSYTISVRPSKKKKLEKLFGSLTKFVDNYILTNNI